MSFTADTSIAVPSGATQIGELRAADLVLATGRNPDRQQYEIKLAEAEAAVPGQVVTVQLNGGKRVSVSRDQFFLVPGGDLRSAVDLTAGDTVLGAGRRPIKVVAVAPEGNYAGELCDIATSSPDAYEGHLLEANGVIVAD